MSFQKLSVIIPAYNEEATIETIIARVRAVHLPQGLNRQIVVIDDGSVDSTDVKVANLVGEDLLFIKQTNQGKTAAINTGLRQSTGDIVLIQDADLEYDPAEYPLLLQPILNGSSEVVYGSRFLGTIVGMQPVNRCANVISNWTFRLLYGVNITDINTCYKVFTRKALEGIVITTKGFAFETEMTIKVLRKRLNIVEIPISYQARSRAAGKKIRWATALEMFWPIIQYRFIKN